MRPHKSGVRTLPSQQARSTSSGRSHTAPYFLSGAIDVLLTGRGVQASWYLHRASELKLQNRDTKGSTLQPHASSSLPAQPNSPPRNAKTSLPGVQHVVGSKPHCPVLPFGGGRRRAADRARRAGILARARDLSIYATKGSTTRLLLPACPTQFPAQRIGMQFVGDAGKKLGLGPFAFSLGRFVLVAAVSDTVFGPARS